MKKLTSPLAAALLALQPLAAAAPASAASPPTEIARAALGAQANATRPTPTPTPAETLDSDVVRITTNLVQIDAVVTDKQGRLVTDLGPEDFEVLEDGEPREITNFSFVSAGAPATTAAADPAPKKSAAERAAAPPVPPARLRPGQVRRTVALVVDDLGTSFESMAAVRVALKKYVDEQMQDGDLVAILRTSAGMGALQQFTSDRRQLHSAIERVRWYPGGRAGVGVFAAIEPDPLAQAREDADRNKTEEQRAREREERSSGGAGESLDEFREEIFSVGTLGALNYIIRGLREMPGRKSVVLFSDGFEIFNADNQSTRLLEALRRLTDLANRASVVVYTLDARGLATTGLTAADNTQGLTADQLAQRLSDRRAKLINTQDGMNYLAQQTGGFFVRNTNDLSGGVRRILEDQKGYYLIGYRPDADTFDSARGRGRFNKVAVRLRDRPDLRVRTRAGFFGFTEEERPVRRTRQEQLMAAITSPFGSNEVPLRLTSVYSSEGERQDFISTLVHIDPRKFKFEEEADGWRKTVIDVVALTFGDGGQIVDEINRTETIRARGESFDDMLRNGLIFSMKLPVKKPGAYQLRIAVRDAGGERTGSASQFVEVPNLSKNRLALSGLVVMGVGSGSAAANDAAPGAAGASPPSPPQQSSAAQFDPDAVPAVRRFRRGTSIEYYLHIYNPKIDPATGKPALLYHARLFRDGQQVFAGTPIKYDPGQQTDMKRLLAGSRLRLGAGLPPGDYVLQVVVNDTLAKEKHRMATQWIDFEIVK